MEQEKVTIRFESSMDSPSSEPLLLSGPIQIFGSVDTIEELTAVRTNSTDTYTLMDAIFEAPDDLPQIVVFVNNVGDVNENSQPNRGSYFLFVGDRKGVRCDITDWQEILLGTHSHENKAQLDSLAEISSDDAGKLIAVADDGTFKVIENVIDDYRKLPELPVEYKNKLAELELYKNMNEPEDSEWHHLDADLDLLKDASNCGSEIGNCKSLYYSMIKANKKLYINADGSLSEGTGDSEIALDIFRVNFDPSKKIDTAENVILDISNRNRTALKLALPYFIKDDDKIFLFMDGKILSNNHYEILSRNEKEITFVFNRSEINECEAALSILITRGKLDRFTILNIIKNDELFLVKINNELFKLYLQGEFSRRPQLPQLYLTTNENGEVYWDNKLLPPQYFYVKKQSIKAVEGEDAVFVFDNVNFNIDNGDFPLLFIESQLALDLSPEVVGSDLVVKIPAGSDYLYDKDNSDSIDALLIVIRNSANNSLADEIAEKYVRKEDIIDGKISLGSLLENEKYVKESKLAAFSKIDHIHTNYAHKDHDHDYKYANYGHTHPELATLIALSTKADEAQIRQWIKSFSDTIKNQINEVIEKKFKFDDDGNVIEIMNPTEDVDIVVTENIVNFINEKIEKDGYTLPLISISETKVNLNTVLEYLVKLFEYDVVYSNQILIERRLPVRYKIGGITKDSYEANTKLSTILRDMLNPVISTAKVKNILTPVANTTQLKWFINEGEEYVEVDPLNLLDDKDGRRLYFKVILKNIYGENCYFEFLDEITGWGKKYETTEIVKIRGAIVEKQEDGFYPYETLTFLNYRELPEIEVSWENIEVTDSEGLSMENLNPDGLFFTLQPKFRIDFPDYLISKVYDINSINFEDFYKYNKNSNFNITFNIDEEGYILALLVDSEIDYTAFRIIDRETQTDIKKYFETERQFISNNGRDYDIYYYEVLNTPTKLELRVEIEKEV